MFLPKGVTGMEGSKEGFPSSVDFRAFREHCYAVARQANWTVRHILTPRQAIACNYGLAVLASPISKMAIALNEVFPLLAFATPPEEGQVELNFADCPELMSLFQQLGYTVLSSAELIRPLTRDLWQDLGPQERKRVRHFRPRRVGDVIYNCWD